MTDVVGQLLIGDGVAIVRQAVEEHFPEVDGLPARNQPLRGIRRLMKAEMPQHGVGLHLVPRLETGDRNVENHHRAARRLGMEAGQRVGDHAPVIVAGDVGLLQREMTRQPGCPRRALPRRNHSAPVSIHRCHVDQPRAP